MKKNGAVFLGTFWLVRGGCGSEVVLTAMFLIVILGATVYRWIGATKS